MTVPAWKSVLFTCLLVTLASGKNDPKELAEKDITITPANFYEPCYQENFCFFLPFFPADEEEYEIEIDKVGPCTDKAKFCMKVNMKPAAADCSAFTFEMAAMNVQDKDYIAVGFRQDASAMKKLLLVYCKASSMFRGIIRNSRQPGDVSVEWSENPTLTGGTFKDGFLRCSFTTSRVVSANGGDVQIKPIDFSSGDFNMLVAHGLKNKDGNDFKTGDVHEEAGKAKLSKTKLVGCGKPPPTKKPKPPPTTKPEEAGPGPSNGMRSSPLNILTLVALGIITLIFPAY